MLREKNKDQIYLPVTKLLNGLLLEVEQRFSNDWFSGDRGCEKHLCLHGHSPVCLVDRRLPVNA
jgi:hypothetical protein